MSHNFIVDFYDIKGSLSGDKHDQIVPHYPRRGNKINIFLTQKHSRTYRVTSDSVVEVSSETEGYS